MLFHVFSCLKSSCFNGMTGSQVLFTSVISDWDCSVGTGFAHGSFGRSLDYFG